MEFSINGTKYVSAHPDEESVLDKKLRLIVGIAYGPGVRTLRIRDRKTKKIVYDFVHEPCCFQEEFTHEIPIQKKVKGERISLTFRHLATKKPFRSRCRENSFLLERCRRAVGAGRRTVT